MCVFGLVLRIMMLGKRRIIKELDYVDLIINYLKRGGWGSIGHIWVSIFEASNSFVDMGLG